MSRLDKISIQGIRSFGSEDKDRAILKFSSPMTLIVGPNGTGKTTIIECLKYMTTGEFPAGARINGAFIKDPKIQGVTDVMAQVRLQFYDIQGARCVAQRSLVATQKKNKVEMKTLEGLIQRKAADGSNMQLSSKCAETDKEMISLLGVSKAILENVIFCHQEESNWPLSEGKALKQKFDDIFASTRYVKALDVIRKCRLEKNGLLKEYNAEMKYLTENKKRFEEVNARLTELNLRKKVCVEAMQQAGQQLQPLEEKLNVLETQEENIRQMSNIIAKLEGEREQVMRLVEGLKKNIGVPFEGSMQELEEEMRSFKCELKLKEKQLKENEDKQTMLEEEAKEVQRERSKVDREHAMLQQDAKRHEEKKGQRDGQVADLLQKYLPSSLPLSNALKGREVVRALQKVLSDLNQQLKSKKEEHAREAGRLQREMDGRRDERMRLETEKILKEKALRTKGEEVRGMEGRLQRMHQSVDRLQSLEKEMQQRADKLQDLKDSYNVDEMRAAVASMQKQRSLHDVTIRRLDDDLRLLHEDTSTRTQVEVYAKERASKEANIKRILAKNEDSLRHIMGEVPVQDLKKRLNDYIREQSRRVRQGQEARASLKNNLTQATTTHKNEREKQEGKEREARAHEERLAEVTGGEDLDQGLSNLATKLQLLQDNKGNLLSIDCISQNYISKLRRQQPDCPLCHRPFDEQSEVDELISEMEAKLQRVPEKLQQATEAVEETSRVYEAWMQLKPVKEALDACRNVELPRISENILRLSKEMTALSSQLAEKDAELEADLNDESVAKAMTSDVTIVEKLLLDMKDIDNKVNVLSKKLKNDSISKTVEEVQEEKTAQMKLLDALVARLEDDKAQLDRVCVQLHEQQQRLHDLRSERLKIEEELREKLQLEEALKEASEEVEVLKVQVVEMEEELIPMTREIEELLRERSEKEEVQKRQEVEEEEKVAVLKGRLARLEGLQGEVERYEEEGGGAKLKECASKLARLDARVAEGEGERGGLLGLVEALRSGLAQWKERERALTDNKLLMEKEQEVRQMEARMQEERQKLGGCDVTNLLEQKNALKNQAEVHYKKLEVLKTRRTHADGEISSLKTELATASLEDAVNKHRTMQIKIKTTDLVCNDLDKYYKALDKSIMSYHVTKMSELNKVIRELWDSTYKGGDIDYICIRSDEEEESGAGKLRRTYKYRVVMKQGKGEVDMRGRCSAGQKVLASLIIRLALAETFCINCGVLALDEPTTNLDRENIESLAVALTRIIRSRSSQRNFQLIVITHDEDFVDSLGRSDCVDTFYRVSKDEETGNSRLNKFWIQDLQSK